MDAVSIQEGELKHPLHPQTVYNPVMYLGSHLYSISLQGEEGNSMIPMLSATAQDCSDISQLWRSQSLEFKLSVAQYLKGQGLIAVLALLSFTTMCIWLPSCHNWATEDTVRPKCFLLTLLTEQKLKDFKIRAYESLSTEQQQWVRRQALKDVQWNRKNLYMQIKSCTSHDILQQCSTQISLCFLRSEGIYLFLIRKRTWSLPSVLKTPAYKKIKQMLFTVRIIFKCMRRCQKFQNT